jgi:hypothetical protein
MTDAWIPPDNPDPSKILTEAADDIGERRYETALAKFLWFHEHALEYDRRLGPVRLSFAIGYWYLLAKRYPPAMEALRRARDDAERAFAASDYASRNYFQDFEAISGELGENGRVSRLFKQVARTDHEGAKRIYHVAEKFLVKEGEYTACAPFLDPRRVEDLAEHYGLGRGRYDGELEAEMEEMRRRYFTERVGTLVALLVLNGREGDAKSAYSEALKTLDDAEFRTALDAAMTGHFPAPWNG